MRMTNLRRIVCVAALFAATATPAFAQSFSPADAICGLINFQFCPQGVPATPPHADAAPAFATPPTEQKAAALPEKHKKLALHKKRAKKVSHKTVKPKSFTPAKTAD
ncbi:MAG: hypothetical protein ACYC56_14260 [Candidatus Aquicultor sp.]